MEKPLGMRMGVMATRVDDLVIYCVSCFGVYTPSYLLLLLLIFLLHEFCRNVYLYIHLLNKKYSLYFFASPIPNSATRPCRVLTSIVSCSSYMCSMLR